MASNRQTRKVIAMNLPTQKVPDENSSSSAVSKPEAELREAVDRVYERYGSDLSAFYRDALREMVLKRQDRGDED